MKKFALSLIVLCSLASPLLAEQDTSAPQDKVAQQDAVAQPDTVAPQDAVAQQDTVVEEIVARVNNSIVTRADLRRNQEQSSQDTKDQSLTQEQIDRRQANALRDLIDQQLLLQKAAELGISADADLVKRLDELRKQMKAASMEDLQKIAESQGVSWEEFKQNTRNGILTQKVIGSEVGSRIQITRDELQKFYDAHQEEISQPERIRLSEILIANDPGAPKTRPLEPTPEQVAAAQAKVDQIYQQLKDGAKFDELARKQSNGSTAEQGGDLGYFKRNDLAKELEDQSFALKAGEFTKPIRTRQGFIILHVDDRMEAGTPPLDRIRDQIQDQIYTLKIQPALRDYLTKLREAAYIDIKPGFTDSGASPNQTKLIYANDVGPLTKQVRGKLGMGKKKTIVIVGKEKDATTVGSTSELGSAKSEVDAKKKAIEDRKAAEDAAAAKAVADAAEKDKLSHMSPRERSKYLAAKKRTAKKEAKLLRQEKLKQKEAAENEAELKADQARAAKHGKKSAKAAPAKAAPAETTPQANVTAKDRSDQKAAAAKAAQDAAKAQADADAAELAKLKHMTRKERAQYLAKKKQDAKQAKKEAAKNGNQSAQAASADSSQQADASAPPKKKKSISWF